MTGVPWLMLLDRGVCAGERASVCEGDDDDEEEEGEARPKDVASPGKKGKGRKRKRKEKGELKSQKKKKKKKKKGRGDGLGKEKDKRRKKPNVAAMFDEQAEESDPGEDGASDDEDEDVSELDVRRAWLPLPLAEPNRTEPNLVCVLGFSHDVGVPTS